MDAGRAPEAAVEFASPTTYEVVSVLSDSSHSRVDLVVDSATSEQWVRKSVSTIDLPRQLLQQLRTEVALLRELNHPNIIGLREQAEEAGTSRFVTILTYVPGCDCKELLAKRKGIVDEGTVAGIVAQVLCALSYCHSHNVIHRDVKPENVMVTKDRKCGYHATLIDFGCASRVKAGGLQQAAGTQEYMAPEMLVGSPHYDAKVDVWSLGATAFEMLTGQAPFGCAADHGGDANVIARNIRKFSRCKDPHAVLAEASGWKDLSEGARDFLALTLAADPDVRPAASEAASHSWLALNRRSDARRSRSIGGA